MKSLYCLPSTLLFLLLLSSVAHARIWTNQSGKEIEADFVDADETLVTLKKSDGQIVKFKIELLSEPDQTIIRNILLRRTLKPAKPEKKTDDAPAEKVATEKPADSEKTTPAKTPLKIEDRTWTDDTGKTVTARFLRMVAGMAVLSKSGRPLNVPFAKLSEKDQQYIREVLESRGEKLNLPDAPTIAGNKFGPPSQEKSLKVYEGLKLENGETVTAEMIESLPQEQKDYLLTWSKPFFADSRQETMNTAWRKYQDQLQAEKDKLDRAKAAELAKVQMEEHKLKREAEAAERQAKINESSVAATEKQSAKANPFSIPKIPQPTAVPGNDPLASNPSPTATQSNLPAPSSSPIHLKQCLKCKGVVPGHLTTGDKCPHCGTVFSFDVSRGDARPSSDFYKEALQYFIGTLLLPIIIVVFYAVKFARKMIGAAQAENN